jgi:hypothetical protein
MVRCNIVDSHVAGDRDSMSKGMVRNNHSSEHLGITLKTIVYKYPLMAESTHLSIYRPIQTDPNTPLLICRSFPFSGLPYQSAAVKPWQSRGIWWHHVVCCVILAMKDISWQRQCSVISFTAMSFQLYLRR